MGHALGLGHSADAAALMYWDAFSKNTFSAFLKMTMDGITYFVSSVTSWVAMESWDAEVLRS